MRRFVVNPKGIKAASDVRASEGMARELFDAFKEMESGNFPMEIDSPDIIAWYDDSGEGMKVLEFQDVVDNLPELMKVDEEDRIFELPVYSLDIGDAIRLYKQYGEEVPDWLLDELSDRDFW